MKEGLVSSLYLLVFGGLPTKSDVGQNWVNEFFYSMKGQSRLGSDGNRALNYTHMARRLRILPLHSVPALKAAKHIINSPIYIKYL